MDETPIGRAVQQSMEIELACVLCSRSTRSRGVYMPDERAIIYALCDDHLPDEATVDAIEAALQAQGRPGNH